MIIDMILVLVESVMISRVSLADGGIRREDFVNQGDILGAEHNTS